MMICCSQCCVIDDDGVHTMCCILIDCAVLCNWWWCCAHHHHQLHSTARNKSSSIKRHCAQQYMSKYNNSQISSTARNNAWLNAPFVIYAGQGAQQIIINYTALCATTHQQLNDTVLNIINYSINQMNSTWRNNSLSHTTTIRYTSQSAQHSIIN